MTSIEPHALVSSTLLLMVLLVFVLAGFVKGTIGLGLPTVTMALLALMMPPAEAAALLIAPSLVTNVWQIRPFVTVRPILRRLLPAQIGVFFGTLAGSWVLGAPAGAWAMVALGGSLICYAVWGILGAQVSVRPTTERWLGPATGAITGLITSATGVFVIPLVPYLQALELPRDELIQAMGISFTVSTISLAAGLYFNDHYSLTNLSESLLMVFPALGGMAIGQQLRQRLSPALFRKCFLVSLILLGVYMIVNELFLR